MSQTWEEQLRDLPGIVLRSDNKVYPSVSAALEAINWLESNSYIVLGIDGLGFDGQAIHTRFDAIADSLPIKPMAITGSWDERVRTTAEAARETLTHWLGRVQFVDLVVRAPLPDQ